VRPTIPIDANHGLSPRKSITNNRPTDKDKYISADRTRLASLFSIPIVPEVPSPFPPNTLPAQRALCTIQAQHPEKLPEAFEVLYRTFWVEGQAIGELDIVAKSLAEVFGEARAREISEGTGKKETKALLNENSKQAVEAGVFGVPFWAVRDGEGRESVFFGFDRVRMVVDALGLGRGEDRGLRAVL
jgi:2-hydroxychromene-2-carboxylate isomerase